MKFKILSVIATVALAAGCSGQQSPAQNSTPVAVSSPSQNATAGTEVSHGYPLGSKKKGDLALCAICTVNDGTTAEEAAVETIDYEGKTYTFCNESEKATFISSPEKFAAK